MSTGHGLRLGIGFVCFLEACSSGKAKRTDAGTGGTGGTGDASSDERLEAGPSAMGGVLQGDLGSGDGISTGGVPATGGIVSSGGMVATGGAAGGGSGSGGAGFGGVQAAVDASLDLPRIDASTPDLPQVDSLAVTDAQVDAPAGTDTGLDASARDSSTGGRNTCVGPASAALANAAMPPGFCAWTWASGLAAPRGIMRNPNGDLMVVEQSAGRIMLLYDDDGNGISDTSERVAMTITSGLNHGIVMQGGYLYASSDSTVYRWPYSGGRQALGIPQTVVSGMPTGGHSTRTLLFDGDGRLYVAIGSGSNVDSNSSRAKIIRFAAGVLATGATYAQGEVFAEGMRNEVGLTLDSQGRVWGVENGVDNLSRDDLGGDIHNDNPGEELNLFATPGLFYGYPYCWSEFLLPAGVGMGPGTQWVHPQFIGDGAHTDAWCQDKANVVPPVLSMQAHSAPLDIKFYLGGAFPADMAGSAIISFHGSWDRTAATGYKVVRIPFGADGMPSGNPIPLLEYAGAGDTGSGWPHRPVGIETGVDGRLFVSSDASGIIIAIGYNGG